MSDPYASFARTLSDPATRGVPVIKSDSTVFDPTKGLYVGTGGDVVLCLVDDPSTPITFKNMGSGSYHPDRVVKVMATGTTAADIVALY